VAGGGIFGATPKHPFINHVLNQLQNSRGTSTPEKTGPGFFSRCYNETVPFCKTLPSKSFYPFHFDQDEDKRTGIVLPSGRRAFGKEFCGKDVYAIHHFAGTWVLGSDKK
jgi:hypothetical protein